MFNPFALCLTSLLTLLPLLPLTLSAAASTYSQEACTTKLGKTSKASVGSTTYVLTIPITLHATITSTPSTTITPPASTLVVTSSATTTTTTTLAPTTTTIISTTSVSTSTIDSSVVVTVATITSLVTVPAVTTTSTSTIPASPGFTPVASESGYVAKKRAIMRPQKRAIPVEEVQVKARGLPNIRCNPPLYPTTVTCGKLVEVVTTQTTTLTAKSTTTLTAATPTSTSTTTTTITITSTSQLPDATTTTTLITVTTTNLGLTTTTATVTSNITPLVVSTTTVYAACATNNLVSTANGGQNIQAVYFNNVFPTTTNTDTAYDCCVSCLNTAGCGGSAFADSSSGNECILLSANTCDPTMSSGNFFSTTPFASGADTLTISNSNCGQVSDGGDTNENGIEIAG